METLFFKLLNMSISAGYLVLAVIALRPLLRKTPGYLKCLLWGLVGIRLILPALPQSRLSLIPSAQTQPVGLPSAQLMQGGISAIHNAATPSVTNTAPVAGAASGQILGVVCTWVWIIGVAAMLVYALVSYLRVRSRVRSSIKVGTNLHLCDHIDSAFILGIAKPQIYLPSYLDQTSVEHVLAHENAHIHRGDHLWKPLAFALLAVYWFNPLMWAAYILLCRDIELACDEKVICNLAPEQKKSYSRALLRCSVEKRFITACPLAFGEVAVSSRIKSVLCYKKPTFWIFVAAAAEASCFACAS